MENLIYPKHTNRNVCKHESLYKVRRYSFYWWRKLSPMLKKKLNISQPLRCIKLTSLIRSAAAQHTTMSGYWVILVLLVLNVMWARGTCPDSCRCPSVNVVNCVSVALRKVPRYFVSDVKCSSWLSVYLSERAFYFRVETGDFMDKIEQKEFKIAN